MEEIREKILGRGSLSRNYRDSHRQQWQSVYDIVVHGLRITHSLLSRQVVLNSRPADPTSVADDGILRGFEQSHDLWPHLHVFNVVGIVDHLDELSQGEASGEDEISST